MNVESLVLSELCTLYDKTKDGTLKDRIKHEIASRLTNNQNDALILLGRDLNNNKGQQKTKMIRIRVK